MECPARLGKRHAHDEPAASMNRAAIQSAIFTQRVGVKIKFMRTSCGPAGTSLHHLFVKGHSAFDAVALPPANDRKIPCRGPVCARANQTPRRGPEPNQAGSREFPCISRAGSRMPNSPGHNVAPQILHPAGDVTLARGIKAGQGGDFFIRQRLLQQRPHIRFIRHRCKKQNRSGIFPNGRFLEPVANLRGHRVARCRGNFLQHARGFVFAARLWPLECRFAFSGNKKYKITTDGHG